MTKTYVTRTTRNETSPVRTEGLARAAGRMTGALAVLLLAIGCGVPETPVRAENGGESDEQVVAVIGDRQIMQSEAEEAVATELMNLERERRDLLERGLEVVAEEVLLEMEAESEDVTPEELMESELAARSTAPSDEEVNQFYEQRKAQIQAPKEQVLPQIREFLEQQGAQQARADLIAELKEKYGYASQFEPFKVEVETAGHPSKGSEDAVVTIVEFSDFECPFCGRVNPTLDQVMDKYGDKVRIVFRQFPLTSIHPNAFKAAEASLCANEQDNFWEFHDAMFREQRNLGVDQLKEKAARLGLDTEDFNDCLDSSRFAEQVQEDLRAGQELGVTGTPAVFINGRFLSGAQPFEEFARVIDNELG